MRDRLQALVDRFGGLSIRERVLVLVALFAVAYQVGTLVVFDRQFDQIESLRADIARDNETVLSTNRQLAAALAKIPEDPNQVMRQSIAELRVELDQARQALKAETATLISPQDMARFLEQLLLQERGLALISLNTLETQPLSEQAPDTAEVRGNTVVGLHRHGFDIAFSGGYLATLRYLQALEALPWHFFWDSVDYEVIEYPESTVRLRLHTLSLSEDWIGV